MNEESFPSRVVDAHENRTGHVTLRRFSMMRSFYSTIRFSRQLPPDFPWQARDRQITHQSPSTIHLTAPPRPPFSGYTLHIMSSLLTRSTARRASLLFRSFSTSSPNNAGALLLVEQRAGALNPATLNAFTAAKKLGGELTGLVVGGEEEVKGVVEKAKK